LSTKYLFLLLITLVISLDVFAQPKTAKIYVYEKDTVVTQYEIIPHDSIDYKNLEPEKKTALYIGFLNGGGSLIGADIEFLITKQIGLQVGAGLIGYGFAVNFHFKPNIKSSGISLSYWHQGIGDSFVQSIFGPTYVYRSKKWFTMQIGLGVPLDTGPALLPGTELPSVMLMYSIGGYFAW